MERLAGSEGTVVRLAVGSLMAPRMVIPPGTGSGELQLLPVSRTSQHALGRNLGVVT